MTTPEGKVKTKVREILDHPNIWSFWPVPSGYQARTLDVLCAVRVRNLPIFFTVEVKKPGKRLTEAQSSYAQDLKEKVNARTFRAHDPSSLAELEQWLTNILSL